MIQSPKNTTFTIYNKVESELKLQKKLIMKHYKYSKQGIIDGSRKTEQLLFEHQPKKCNW